MARNISLLRVIISVVILGIGLIFCDMAAAADAAQAKALLPASAEPGVVGQTLSQQPSPKSQTLPPEANKPAQPVPNPLGPQAEKIRFKLTKIILQGNTVYSEQQLLPLYKAK